VISAVAGSFMPNVQVRVELDDGSQPVVGTTDCLGHYDLFVPYSGASTMVTVSATTEGVRFQPPKATFEHKEYFQMRRVDFEGYPASG
jgi:hypothetical protein